MLVSIITPSYNEEKYIQNFIDNVFSQNVDFVFELIIADGSNDNTKDIIKKNIINKKNLILLNNPKRIVSEGLNKAIKKSVGDIIVRMDVHTKYDNYYLSNCVKVLKRTKADCIGGPWNSLGKGKIGNAISKAFNHPFSIGAAKSRLNNYSGYVDTVYLGCWYKTKLISLKGFDQKFVRNQDDELCFRIKMNGGKIYQDKSIVSYYYVRESFYLLFKQFYQYGYWKFFILKKYKRPASLRHLIPLFFVLYLFLIPFLIWINLKFIFPLLIYILILIIISMKDSKKLIFNINLTKAITIIHFSYGLGFLFSFMKNIINIKVENKLPESSRE
tara:strand:- start:427 stop:1416 length:990 start_codon:yes stop_codon:yes gene_type:complete